MHQLLVPFLPLTGDLPGPQRQAIAVAFGLEAGPPPDSFLVALACLTLLSRAAANQPVLRVIDDAHWIDGESARVIGYVSRRLYADRVGVILADGGCAGSPAFEQLPAIEVGALPDDAAADLLRSVVGTPLDPQAVDRVLADTERNPLALVEVGSHWTAGELAERAYQPEPIPVGRLTDRYLRRVRGLPTDAQEFLLLTAADVSGDLGLVRRAAAEAGIDADPAEKAAETAGLIEVSGSFARFRHPLIRAAIYHGAADADRRRAHHCLGQAAGRGDEGRMWHRAAAAAGPDESLAADLEAAAERARGRGGACVSSVGLLRRAVALTPDDGRRARREVDLAKSELAIGRPGTAQAVVRRFPRCPGCPMTAPAGERKRLTAWRCSPRVATPKPPMS